MKKKILTIIMAATTAGAVLAQNPFLKPYKTPFETVPFNSIKIEHYKPAFETGIAEHRKEIARIVRTRQTADFQNTIVALEESGATLKRVSAVFFNLLEAESSDQMMQLAQEIQPMMTAHSNSIYLNTDLFEKVKYVYQNREKASLTPEQLRLTEETYRSFEDSGATLSPDDKKKYEELSMRLSQLTLTFGQNVLKSTNAFELLLTEEAELDGLPENVRSAALSLAEEKGKSGWLFDLSAPSYVAFMKYSARRDLRQQLYTAYNTRAMGGEYDNRPVLIDIANTRLQIARLLGYSDYATYALRDKMAKNKETVNNFLSQLLEAYALAARSDVSLVKGFAVGYEQTNIDLQPYDWSYYSEKLKAAAYSVSDDAVRPYFELENVKKGIFGLATTLYGLTFTKNTQIQVYHPDVEAFEVRNSEGKLMAILYTDYHPRQGKRAGAWMTEFAGQWQQAGKDHRPLVSLVMNFTRPDGDTPALLTFDEAETFIHEFGHGLQAILSQCTYEGLSGTSVARDYVEMPSQIMENWLREKEFLNRFAFHYKTGEIMPDTLLKNIVNAANFNAGYLCYRQLGFALLDMAWHTIESPYSGEARSFEQKATAAAALLPVVQGTMTSPSFGHIFDGGYAAGYYGYKWSEMLDADAFAVFKKEGIFNKSTAERFRSAILSRGNTADPMILFKEFTGHAPTIDALLERTGVK